jgi:peptidoglycan/xylan/chitin deacetylase (PgdA/CDA1 family)
MNGGQASFATGQNNTESSIHAHNDASVRQLFFDFLSELLRQPDAMLRFLALLCCVSAFGLEPIPDKLVVLTFDDSKASHFSFVRPLLKENGFGATFFITEGFTFATDKTNYLTWEQIAQLHRDGFEIGNHTRDHMGVTKAALPKLREQVEVVNAHLAEHGVPKPVSFSWPGNAITPEAFPILRELGIQFARRGGAPEYAYEQGRGFAFEPGADHPLFIPSAGDSRPTWTFDAFKRAVDQARGGRIAVLQFHGVPDVDHPWVKTDPELFRQYIKYLHDEHFHVTAMRDLARYVDPAKWPADAMAIIEARKKLLEAK